MRKHGPMPPKENEDPTKSFLALLEVKNNLHVMAHLEENIVQTIQRAFKMQTNSSFYGMGHHSVINFKLVMLLIIK